MYTAHKTPVWSGNFFGLPAPPFFGGRWNADRTMAKENW